MTGPEPDDIPDYDDDGDTGLEPDKVAFTAYAAELEGGVHD